MKKKKRVQNPKAGAMGGKKEGPNTPAEPGQTARNKKPTPMQEYAKTFKADAAKYPEYIAKIVSPFKKEDIAEAKFVRQEAHVCDSNPTEEEEK